MKWQHPSDLKRILPGRGQGCRCQQGGEQEKRKRARKKKGVRGARAGEGAGAAGALLRTRPQPQGQGLVFSGVLGLRVFGKFFGFGGFWGFLRVRDFGVSGAPPSLPSFSLMQKWE